MLSRFCVLVPWLVRFDVAGFMPHAPLVGDGVVAERLGAVDTGRELQVGQDGLPHRCSQPQQWRYSGRGEIPEPPFGGLRGSVGAGSTYGLRGGQCRVRTAHPSFPWTRQRGNSARNQLMTVFSPRIR